MANTTRISDGFVPDRWQEWMMVDTMTKNALFQSGVITPSGQAAELLSSNQGGRTLNSPFWKDLSDDEPNLASDDPAVESVPEKLTSGKDVCRRQIRTKSFSTADLTPEITGGDPMSRMRNAASRYWNRHFQRSLVRHLTGLFTDNINNDSGDMVYTVSNDSATTATSAELIGAEQVIEAEHTMGDRYDSFSVIMMHSVVYKRLQKLNLIDYIPDAEGRIMFTTYLGKRVIVDDGCHTVVGTNRTTYWTYLAAPGAVGWGESPVAMPAEVERKPAQGNGMGVEIIHTRRQYVMHVPGVKWTESSVAGEFPSYADLANPANHNRVYAEREQIKLALLRTNG